MSSVTLGHGGPLYQMVKDRLTSARTYASGAFHVSESGSTPESARLAISPVNPESVYKTGGRYQVEGYSARAR